MAGNKFATMLHRNTNNMVVILVYAVLEWVLIVLLLFNSLFSYLITKLAESPGKSTNLYKDLLCETHGRVMKMVSKNTEKCSCCNESLSNQIYPPYLLMNPSWGDENFTSKGSRIVESIDDEKEGDREKNGENHDHEDEGIRDEHQTFSDIESFILREVAEDRSSSFSNLHSDGKDAEKEDKEDDLIITKLDPSGADNFIHQLADTSITRASLLEDRSHELMNMYFEDYVACDTCRLIPVKLIDSITSLNFESSCKLEEDLGENEQKIQTFATESPIEAQLSILEEASLLTMDNNAKKTSMREIESLANFIVFDFEELKQNSLLVRCRHKGLLLKKLKLCRTKTTMLTQPQKNKIINKSICLDLKSRCTFMKAHKKMDLHQVNNLSESESLSNDDNNVDTSTEEPNNTAGVDLSLSQEPVGLCDCTDEDESSTSDDDDDIEVQNAFNEFIAQNNLNNSPILSNGDNNVESATEKPDYTPQELEEERSASAIATNQTMAMITRLQEEKATMQMEALQYQRMMEEQAEYDQEALQFLNELMVKREKEKQELEKELEEYRQKVMDYESKERLRVLKRMKDGTVRSRDSCSCSCSNVDLADDHELSIDLNCETRDGDNCYEENSHNNTTADTVSNLEDMALDCVNHISVLDNSLAEFEEERASILDQLKALEENIICLVDNEEFLDDINLIEHSSTYDENGLNEKCNFSSPEDNMYPNGFSDDKHSPKGTMGSLAKRLLPYLDAAEDEAREEEANAFDTQLEPESADMQNSVPIQEMDSMKVSIEEEVDRVYERLQALETDREFLKHCVGSMQNGDKGVDLLQEILQHLRDLKTVEHRLKNLGLQQHMVGDKSKWWRAC
ncbi:unnamed protein product [Lupinus luteus]|uniref:GTD-binding domain-containing protein n=1 Tax=Lupinus luteus TaxID=3873 RepID=A0AAV1WEW4_LUPLU